MSTQVERGWQPVGVGSVRCAALGGCTNEAHWVFRAGHSPSEWVYACHVHVPRQPGSLAEDVFRSWHVMHARLLKLYGLKEPSTPEDLPENLLERLIGERDAYVAKRGDTVLVWHEVQEKLKAVYPAHPELTPLQLADRLISERRALLAGNVVVDSMLAAYSELTKRLVGLYPEGGPASQLLERLIAERDGARVTIVATKVLLDGASARASAASSELYGLRHRLKGLYPEDTTSLASQCLERLIAERDTLLVQRAQASWGSEPIPPGRATDVIAMLRAAKSLNITERIHVVHMLTGYDEIVRRLADLYPDSHLAPPTAGAQGVERLINDLGLARGALERLQVETTKERERLTEQRDEVHAVSRAWQQRYEASVKAADKIIERLTEERVQAERERDGVKLALESATATGIATLRERDSALRERDESEAKAHDDNGELWSDECERARRERDEWKKRAEIAESITGAWFSCNDSECENYVADATVHCGPCTQADAVIARAEALARLKRIGEMADAAMARGDKMRKERDEAIGFRDAAVKHLFEHREDLREFFDKVKACELRDLTAERDEARAERDQLKKDFPLHGLPRDCNDRACESYGENAMGLCGPCMHGVLTRERDEARAERDTIQAAYLDAERRSLLKCSDPACPHSSVLASTKCKVCRLREELLTRITSTEKERDVALVARTRWYKRALGAESVVRAARPYVVNYVSGHGAHPLDELAIALSAYDQANACVHGRRPDAVCAACENTPQPPEPDEQTFVSNTLAGASILIRERDASRVLLRRALGALRDVHRTQSSVATAIEELETGDVCRHGRGPSEPCAECDKDAAHG